MAASSGDTPRDPRGASPPSRPKLAAHVLARRHIVDGDERIVLHDLANERLIQVGPREWGLLSAADGTRDVTGIVLAAAREGAHARPSAVEAFLEQLHAAGMLEDGDVGTAREPEPEPEPEPQPEPEPEPEPEPGEPRDPLLDVLPAFGLNCDGSGSCCRIYASVFFGPVEVARARALLPTVLDGGERHERVFTPEHGSAPTGGSAVAQRDGRCVYLSDRGRCGLHEMAGPAAKPTGCNFYPATFVDDGESVRVSVAPECACVLASADLRAGDGAALVPEGARRRSDLPGWIDVASLPAIVEISPTVQVPRAEIVAWSRRTEEIARVSVCPDLAAALTTLARDVDRRGLDADVARALTAPEPVDAEAMSRWLSALADRAERRAREDASWRSPKDLARRASSWIAATLATLASRDVLEGVLRAPVGASSSETLYLRALLHGHQLALGLPLSVALRDRAARIILARAMPRVLDASAPGDVDPAFAHPLALVEAMLRGHGLGSYARDVMEHEVSG